MTLGTKVARNRIVMPPMVTNMGIASEQAWAYYEERARGGAGTIIIEAVRVSEFVDELTADRIAPLAECIHRHDGLAAVQLFVQDRLEPDGKRFAPWAEDDAAEPTPAELKALQGQLARAAAVCEAAGFDGIEVHGAHCFFLNSFFSPEKNQRTDEYAGSPEGRMRMGLECVRAAVEATPDGFLILYRHTPEWAGYGLEETIPFAKRLVEAGVDVMDISPSTREGGQHARMAAEVRSEVTIPVIAVGGMNDPARAQAALTEGKCDLVAIGRGLLADPLWPEKVRDGREAEIVDCIECNELCFGNLRKGIPISCAQNDDVGREHLSAT